MLTDGLEWCGLLWCFISCLDSHSDGTHSLQSIHCWASDVMLHFSKKQTHLHLEWSEGEDIFITRWTIPSVHYCYTMPLVSLVSLSQVFVHTHTIQRRILLTKQMILIAPRSAHAMWMTLMPFFFFWSLTTSFSYENTSEKYICVQCNNMFGPTWVCKYWLTESAFVGVAWHLLMTRLFTLVPVN